MSELIFFDSNRVIPEEKKQENLEFRYKSNESVGKYADEFVLGSVSDKNFNFEEEKKKMVERLEEYKKLSVEEFTFKKKWEEVKNANKEIKVYGPQVKTKIWEPKDIFDEESTIKEISELQPKIMLVKDDDSKVIWNTLRVYCHSAEFDQTPGRFFRLLVIDEVSGKILGFSAIGSDFIGLPDRDNYIGWTKEDRDVHRMLKHSAVGSTIASTQPLGSNFFGGKLVASMLTTKVVRDVWEQDYGESDGCILVGMTTTSLYGRPSMYDALKWWNGIGLSKGKVPIKPDESNYEIWHKWLKQNRPDEYEKAMTQKKGIKGPVTSAKSRVLSMIFKECNINITKYYHGHERGVYYSMFYENGKEFLQRKILEDKLVMKPLFKNDKQAIIDWWKPKAINRYKKLKSEGRLNPDKLFYNVMDEMSYEKAKDKFFKNLNVGKQNG